MASPSRGRWAITAVFGGNGLIIASLVVRTPQLKLDLDLSPAELGLVSAVFGASAVLAMQVAGALAARVGSGRVVRAAILVLPAGLVGIGAAPTLVALLCLLLPAALVCGRLLLPGYADRRAASAPAWSMRGGWSRRIVVFGAMGATVLTAEAAVANWSGVYLHENLGASLGAAALGYVAFTVCQTAGRLVGDRLQARGSASRLVATGALVAAAGLAVIVLSPWPVAELVGLTWTLAGLIPLLALVARAAGPAISHAPARRALAPIG